MTRILFVDDEPLMRELYASLPRELGKEFQVQTVGSGEAALHAMENCPADIVVSDLSMPEMHGGEFLTSVERIYPEAMRVVISGRADQLAVARCLMYGHRYFLKPLKLKELATLLNRISRLRKVIRSEKVKRIVGRSDVLPTPPETYLRLTELIEDNQSSVDDLAAVVECDPALTAKLLQVVNSAAFAMSGGITTISHAVQVAGVEVVRALLLGLQARAFAEKKLKNRQLLRAFWDHSLDTAIRCRAVAQAEGLDTAEQATCFTVGMLHDIGKLVLAANDEKPYAALVASAVKEQIPLHKKELEIYDATHADIGAYLLGLWGLPDEIVTAVERHHSVGADLGKKFTPVLCVHVAQNLAASEARVRELDEKFLKDCKLSGRIPAWEETLAEVA